MIAGAAATAFDAPIYNDKKVLPMLALILRYGIIAGVIVVAPMLWIWLPLKPGEHPNTGLVTGYLTMLVALTSVFLGVKHYRDKMLGGAVRFLPALGVGLAISAVASILYVIGWEICMAYSSFDFIAWYKAFLVKSASHLPPAEMQKALADAETFAKNYSNPLYRMSFTFIEIFPVGVLVSLVTAAVLRNSRVLPARS
jgi:hypothetical protein